MVSKQLGENFQCYSCGRKFCAEDTKLKICPYCGRKSLRSFTFEFFSKKETDNCVEVKEGQ